MSNKIKGIACFRGDVLGRTVNLTPSGYDEPVYWVRGFHGGVFGCRREEVHVTNEETPFVITPQAEIWGERDNLPFDVALVNQAAI